MNLIKVQAGVATRAPLPDFLVGLLPESLVDLSWTDPALGVQDCAWWPVDDQSPVLGANQGYGAETLTVDAARRVVVAVRAVVAVPPVVPEEISPRQFRQALNKYGFRQQVDGAVAASSDQDLKDWYAYTSAFQRHHPEVLTMAVALGFTEAQLDQVWIYGAAL